jgi:hypothetical protein
VLAVDLATVLIENQGKPEGPSGKASEQRFGLPGRLFLGIIST